ncbi:PREDICTED: probable low affinity copper uptake protein 2 [Crocodylus porosus]|uniref:Copper transport protein n=1 Tax=Crocodylus porosus TaxID=8502 RepID=A0A7M4EZP7_CROPO|nr:PREDICTED: probable low affinity copper uptake protein 2 [Crocodylus porosus]
MGAGGGAAQPVPRAAPAQPRGGMMAMYFFFSDKTVLLFDFWNVHSPAGMALSVVVILLLAALYEVIKVTKGKLLHRTVLSVPTSISQESLEERDRASVNSERGQQNSTQKRWFLYHVSQTLLHVIQVVIGYLVMLAVMSYNTWIFLGVIVGSTVGYYVAYPLLKVR